jgi:hypothetical protein
MKFRRLKVIADPTGIGTSRVIDQESDDMIDGVMNITWTFDPVKDCGIVVLVFDASMIDFEIALPPAKET